MKKISFVILGIIVSMVLYAGLTFHVIMPIQQSSGQSPESYLGIAFMLIMPLCFMLGSMVTGYLIQPSLSKRGIINYLVISPGLYGALVNLLPTIVNAGGLILSFVFFTFISSSVWVILSLLGTRIGIYMKDKKSNNALERDV